MLPAHSTLAAGAHGAHRRTGLLLRRPRAGQSFGTLRPCLVFVLSSRAPVYDRPPLPRPSSLCKYDYREREGRSGVERELISGQDVLQRFRGFGGIRLEDDVLVTADGAENFTVTPHTAEAIEEIMASN